MSPQDIEGNLYIQRPEGNVNCSDLPSDENNGMQMCLLNAVVRPG